jgi:hypothetical protein
LGNGTPLVHCFVLAAASRHAVHITDVFATRRTAADRRLQVPPLRRRLSASARAPERAAPRFLVLSAQGMPFFIYIYFPALTTYFRCSVTTLRRHGTPTLAVVFAFWESGTLSFAHWHPFVARSASHTLIRRFGRGRPAV